MKGKTMDTYEKLEAAHKGAQKYYQELLAQIVRECAEGKDMAMQQTILAAQKAKADKEILTDAMLHYVLSSNRKKILEKLV